NARNASITTSTPSVWCRSACRNRLYSARHWALDRLRPVAIVSERYWLGWEKARTSPSVEAGISARVRKPPPPLPNPCGPIGDKLHHVRIGGPEQPQIPDQQRPDRLGVSNEDIVERQTQAIGLSLLIEDINHQQPGLTPRCGKPVAPLGRLPPTMGAADAHAAAVEADPHSFARQGPVARHGDTQGRRQRCVPQAGAGLRGGR